MLQQWPCYSVDGAAVVVLRRGGAGPWPASWLCCSAVRVLLLWPCYSYSGATALVVLQQWRCYSIDGAAAVALLRRGLRGAAAAVAVALRN